MVLSDKEITSAIKKGELTILPGGFRLNPSGVDLRVDRNVRLKPKQQLLVASMERVELSNGIVGFLHLRSSLAREGIFASRRRKKSHTPKMESVIHGSSG